MIDNLHPGLLLIGGALLVPALGGRLRQFYLLALPTLALWLVWTMEPGSRGLVPFLGRELTLLSVDPLARVFGLAFGAAGLLAVLFALQVTDRWQQVWALIYVGGALGVTFAGEWLSLYLFWELMAVASTFVVLTGRTAAARRAAGRYVLVHIFGGLVLLAGILLRFKATGSLALEPLQLGGLPEWLIFIGLGVNAAFPPLHGWLKDAYPNASATGAVFLSAFTTKSAIYVLARTFPGCELLIPIGAVMALCPIFFALIESDIRAVLAYSIISQLGYMTVGVGLGTELALNGVAAHAVAHIIYKGLLFMSAGAVLQTTGKIRTTELGGLARQMPLTCAACVIGAASIAAVPFFSGFVTKSMILSALGHEGRTLVYLALILASAGSMVYCALRVPYFIFFGPEKGLVAKEPPGNMLLAMALGSALCLGLGLYPQGLYALLPFKAAYQPYTGAHLVDSIQLLGFGALAFFLTLRAGFYPAEIRAENLDADWFYRQALSALNRGLDRFLNSLNEKTDRLIAIRLTAWVGRIFTQGPAGWAAHLGPGADKNPWLARALRTGTLPVGFSAAAALVVFLILYVLEITGPGSP